MKTVAIRLLCLLMCHTGVSYDHLAGKVEVRLHVNRTQFVSGEFIFIDCSVRNLVRKEIRIPLLDPRMTRKFLTLVDSRNQRVPGGVIVGRVGDYPTELLRPKSMVITTFSLASYGNTDSFTGIVRNLKPGRYRLWFMLSDVLSDTLEIEILEPTAQDRLFAERLNTRVSNYAKATVQTAIQEGKELIRAHPNSPYLPNAYFDLMSALQYSDDPLWNSIELKKVAEEYIARFPDFGGTQHAVHKYVDAVMNSIGARHKRDLSRSELSAIEAALRALKTKYPGRRLVRYIDQTIAQLRDRVK